MLRPLRMNTGRLYVDLVMKGSTGSFYAVFSAPGKFDPNTLGTRSEAQAHLRRLQGQTASVAPTAPVAVPPPPVVAPPRPVMAPTVRVPTQTVQETVVGSAGGLPPVEDMLNTRKAVSYWLSIAQLAAPAAGLRRDQALEALDLASGHDPFDTAREAVVLYIGDKQMEAEANEDSELEASLRAARRAVHIANQSLLEPSDAGVRSRMQEYKMAADRLRRSSREEGAARHATRSGRDATLTDDEVRALEAKEKAEREAALRPLNALISEQAALRRELEVRKRQFEAAAERGVPLPGGDRTFVEKNDAIKRRIYQLEQSILNMQRELRRAGFIQ